MKAFRIYAALFAGCVLFHAAGTWSLPLIDRDEPRFAEASREMRQRHDYIIPYFNNHYRFDKPPLTYWAQVASYNLFGENDFAARLPSVIAAALTALIVFAWGSRIGGSRVGFWAAIIFTLALQTFVHAKAAVADMWLVLFVTVAHWAGWELLERSKRPTPNAQRSTPNSEEAATNPFWWWSFYISLALAFLAKGPIGWVPLITLGLVKLWDPSLQIANRFRFARGTLLMLAIILLWAVPALRQTNGEFFRVGIGRHVIGRSFGGMEGHGGNSLATYLLLLPFYFVTVFASFFPWSIKLPSACRRLWFKRDWIDTYLLAGIAVVFVIFTLVKTKLPHYTLPAFPLLALIVSRLLVESATKFLKYCAVTTIVALTAAALIVPRLIAPMFPAWQLFQLSRASLQAEMAFGACEFNEPSLVWYFRSRVAGFMETLNRKQVTEFMAKPGPRFTVLPTKLSEETFPQPPAEWKTFSTHGFNIVKGKSVDLTLVLKPE